MTQAFPLRTSGPRGRVPPRESPFACHPRCPRRPPPPRHDRGAFAADPGQRRGRDIGARRRHDLPRRGDRRPRTFDGRGRVQHGDDRISGDPHRSLVCRDRSSRSPIRTSATSASTRKTSSRGSRSRRDSSSAICRAWFPISARPPISAPTSRPTTSSASPASTPASSRGSCASVARRTAACARRLRSATPTSPMRWRAHAAPRRWPGSISRRSSAARSPTNGHPADGRSARGTQRRARRAFMSSPTISASSTTSCGASSIATPA